jgi:lipid A 3-O-deacylase
MFNDSSSRRAFRAGLLSCSALLSISAFAGTADNGPTGVAVGVYLQGGHSTQTHLDADVATLGVVAGWTPSFLRGSGMSLNGDLSLGHVWGPGRSQEFTQIGGVASLRYRFAQGVSPWFVEGGLGAALQDDLRHRTHLQVTEQIGFGRTFGENGEHELSLRFQNFSNDNKNFGERRQFLSARYLYRFAD